MKRNYRSPIIKKCSIRIFSNSRVMLHLIVCANKNTGVVLLGPILSIRKLLNVPISVKSDLIIHLAYIHLSWFLRFSMYFIGTDGFLRNNFNRIYSDCNLRFLVIQIRRIRPPTSTTDRLRCFKNVRLLYSIQVRHFMHIV